MRHTALGQSRLFIPVARAGNEAQCVRPRGRARVVGKSVRHIVQLENPAFLFEEFDALLARAQP
jgi:hypothetical protein